MWLLPSKGRPANLARFFEAYRKTGGSTPGMVLLGPSDEGGAGYPDLPLGWFYKFCEGETQGEKLAEVWATVKDCTWLGLIGDDCVPETPQWDQQLASELTGWNFVSCNDGWQAPNRVANCWLMSGDLVRAVGYVFPPGLHHLFVDDVWEELSRRTAPCLDGAHLWTCRMDVMVRHAHVLKGEAAADDTHREVYGSDTIDREGGFWPTDRAAFDDWIKTDMDAAVERIAKILPPKAPVMPPETAAVADEAQKRRMARVKARKVLIATPCHGEFTPNFVLAMINTVKLFERIPIVYDHQWVLGSSNLPKARNHLCAHFLAGEYDDLLFIDADMGWAPNSALRLLASDRPIVAAVGRRKEDEPHWCTTLIAGETQHGPMGELMVRRVGTGMMKVAREALEHIVKKRPDLKLPGDAYSLSPKEREHYHRFFSFGDDDMGEDYWFCELWNSLGGQVWIDPSIELSHRGSKDYVGKFSDVLDQMARGQTRVVDGM